MSRKIPTDALAYYIGLGVGRTYTAVAKKYGVTERAVSKVAARERWQEKVAEAERKSREHAVERAIETLDEMNERHLTMMKLLQRKGLEGLRTLSITNAMDAVRALAIGVEKERLIRGEPTERTAQSLEEIVHREHEAITVDEDEPENYADAETDSKDNESENQHEHESEAEGNA